MILVTEGRSVGSIRLFPAHTNGSENISVFRFRVMSDKEYKGLNEKERSEGSPQSGSTDNNTHTETNSTSFTSKPSSSRKTTFEDTESVDNFDSAVSLKSWFSSSSLDSSENWSRRGSVSSRYKSDLLSPMPAPFTISDHVVATSEVSRFISECLLKIGVKEDHTKVMSDVLVSADCIRNYSTALVILDMYVLSIMGKTCDANASPSIIKDYRSTAWVNGNRALGPVVGRFCMLLAIQKAKQSGVGIVVAKNSNYVGDPSWYCEKAVSEGMVGLTFANSPPELCPTRAKIAALGCNRFCFAGPAEHDPFLLNMSNLAASLEKLMEYNNEVRNLPSNWALDVSGEVTVDPEVALDARVFLPLGGVEASGGYKGFGLALMVEALCGILADSSYGPHIQKTDGKYCGISKDLAQCFIAIDPSSFESGFGDRMSDMMACLRNLPPGEGNMPVVVPGDSERLNRSIVNENGGIRYSQVNMNSAYILSKTLRVQPVAATNLSSATI